MRVDAFSLRRPPRVVPHHKLLFHQLLEHARDVGKQATAIHAPPWVGVSNEVCPCSGPFSYEGRRPMAALIITAPAGKTPDFLGKSAA